MKKRTVILLLAGLMTGLLAGCSGKVDLSKADVSTVGVDADGSVSEVVVEAFDKEYYSLEELTSFVNTRIDEFNEDNTGDDKKTAVTLKELKQEEDNVRMTLAYTGAQMYGVFNNITFLVDPEIGDVPDKAQKLTYVDAEGADADYSTVMAEEKYHVVITDAALHMQTSGKIMYYSDNVTLTDEKTADTAGTLSAIVFK